MIDDQEDKQQVEKDDVDWLNDTKKSRDIVMEIMRFGVSQPQIKLIIASLALELEDRDMMISVRNCVEPETEESDSSNDIKILHPGGN
tara:strand:+ start:296 stop:559 length:264 start_codon:yes stop_codon:yes gene_type:complete